MRCRFTPMLLIHQQQGRFRFHRQGDGLGLPRIQLLTQGSNQIPIGNVLSVQPGCIAKHLCARLSASLHNDLLSYGLRNGHLSIQSRKKRKRLDPSQIHKWRGVANDIHIRPS
jgi:hypothetical protein